MRVYKECHLNYLGYKRKSLRVYILTAVRGTPQALLRDLIYSGPEVLVYLGRKDVESCPWRHFSHRLVWSFSFPVFLKLLLVYCRVSSLIHVNLVDLMIQSSTLAHRVLDKLDSTKQMLFHETWIWNSDKLREQQSIDNYFTDQFITTTNVSKAYEYICVWEGINHGCIS